MIKLSTLQAVQDRIAREFSQQCSLGAQLQGLPQGVKACGQFLSSSSTQRGLHGTASAIRVLAGDTTPESRHLVPELVQYLLDREQIERRLRGPAYSAQLSYDSTNVIKISEVLLALDHVPHALAQTDLLIADLRDNLLNGRADARGWGYFLGAGAPHLLPTAYALRGLAAHGYLESLRSSVSFLTDALEDPQALPKAFSADITVHTLCLFALTFDKGLRPLLPEKQLRAIFDRLWKQLEPLLSEDIEQNIEYATNGTHHYVRVPWQLYLLTLAPALRPWRAFASAPSQRRLSAISTEVLNSGGLLYRHSGSELSARTNGILFDCFEVMKRRLPGIPLWPAHLLDRVRRWLNSGQIAIVGASIGLIVAALTVYAWSSNDPDPRELAPHFLAAIFLFLLSLRKRR